MSENSPRIGVFSVHPAAMEAAATAFARDWPEAELHHLLDDRLFHWVRKAGGIEPGMTGILDRHARYLVESGAEALLFTCSAFHDCIADVAARQPCPVLGPNQAMIEGAFAIGSRLALLATVPATLPSLAAELRSAAPGGVGFRLDEYFVTGAFDRLAEGDVAEHDRLVLSAAQQIADADVVLLGQFTLARVRPLLQAHLSAPVLSAPDAAVARLRRLLAR